MKVKVCYMQVCNNFKLKPICIIKLSRNFHEGLIKDPKYLTGGYNSMSRGEMEPWYLKKGGCPEGGCALDAVHGKVDKVIAWQTQVYMEELSETLLRTMAPA